MNASQQRIQKILAAAGIASRRRAEQLIVAGRVRVNGRTVTELGTRANPNVDQIEVDGKRIALDPPVYLILYKPPGYVTTNDDPEGRPTVVQLVRLPIRIYPVGRLDFHTSGALLLTNDGDFTARMMHPRHHVPKTYVVKLDREVPDSIMEIWRKGVELDDGITAPSEVRLIGYRAGKTWLEVTLHEGRNRQIHRMGDATGFPVLRLKRIRFGDIGIDGLRPGMWRFLTPDELRDLRAEYGVPKQIRAASIHHESLMRQASRWQHRSKH